jgi:ABC-2 type transport system permease protein
MMTYYFLIPLVGAFTSVHFSEKIPRKIKDGELSIDFLRPYSPLLAMVANQLAIKTIQNTLKIPAYFIVGSLMIRFFAISFQYSHLIAGVLVCVFTYILHVILDISISLLAFWFDDSWSLSLLKHVAFMIFGGLSFPIDLVPQSLQVIFRLLPFDLIYYLPVSIMMGRIDAQTGYDYLVKFTTWLLLLSVLLFCLWKSGIKKYHAYGQ